MSRRKRKVKNTSSYKAKGRPPEGFDSWLEYELYQDKLSRCDYHVETIEYVQRRTYEPDFVARTKSKTIYIEVKGRFRDRNEARKYIDVIKSLHKDQELVFVFADSRKPMPGAQARKNGTKLTHGEWAEVNNIRYYDLHNIPKGWKK